MRRLKVCCFPPHETNGVGVEKPNQWAFDTIQFDNILKRLKVQAAQPIDEVDEEKKSTEAESDDDLPSEVKDPIVVKATRPQGRYKRKEREKLVDAYSSKDLEGILVKRAASPEINYQDDESEKATKIQVICPEEILLTRLLSWPDDLYCSF